MAGAAFNGNPAPARLDDKARALKAATPRQVDARAVFGDTQHAGGWGLALTLCQPVAQAQGCTPSMRHARPAMKVTAERPAQEQAPGQRPMTWTTSASTRCRSPEDARSMTWLRR